MRSDEETKEPFIDEIEKQNNEKNSYIKRLKRNTQNFKNNVK